MKLSILPECFAICRLPPQQSLPSWFSYAGTLVSVTCTSDECSIVCPEEFVPQDVQSERGWKVIKVLGPLDFSLTGILASLAIPLANKQIPLFALSTFDTDYLLVKEIFIQQAQDVLAQSGHTFIETRPR